MNPDVVVIGGGIVGCSCAYYLAKEGLKVTLLDQGNIGTGASSAGMTHVASWEGPDINLELSRFSNLLYRQLNDELEIDFEMRAIAGLIVLETQEEMKHFLVELDHLRKWGVPCQTLNNQELIEYEPNLSTHLVGGVIFPSDLQVNPLLATQALAHGSKHYGTDIVPNSKVTGFEFSPSDEGIEAVVTEGGRITTKNVVIAAGAWSGLVGKFARLEIPISPRKGTLIVTEPVKEDFLRYESMISAGYLSSVTNVSSNTLKGSPVVYQTKNGNLIIGSSRQFVGFDTRIDPIVVQTMISRCLRFIPGLVKIQAIRTWAGLRPYSSDLLPIISPVEQIRGIYIAAGHEGLGITEGPGTGKLISQMITGQQLDINCDQLAFSRFQKP